MYNSNKNLPFLSLRQFISKLKNIQKLKHSTDQILVWGADGLRQGVGVLEGEGESMEEGRGLRHFRS